MICISVTPESRKLAKVDLLNASRQGDLIELCLDRLIKAPDMKDLLTDVKKPVLVSCRRKEDGGQWAGTEDQRMTLLREAIVAGPAYIELDLDTAKKVPRFGDTKRVISYTSLNRPLGSVDSILQQAAKVNADVVKFTWPTPTLDAAWPLLAAVTKKRDIPVVGLGLGDAGLTFSLLGRKYGSPWMYAALERGMEAFEGQPTVGDLDEIHNWRNIDSSTRFIGIVGFSESEMTTVRLMNELLRKKDVNARVLPFQCKDLDKLKQMLGILKVNAVLTGRTFGSQLLAFADHREEAAEVAENADLLLKQGEEWHAYNSLWRSAIKALESTLGKKGKDDRPLDRCNVLVIGAGPVAQTMAYGIGRRKGLVSVSSGDDKAAKELAQTYDVRYVPFHNMYDTLADVVVISDPDLQIGPKKTEFNPSYMRPPMTIMDVGTMPEDSPFIREARGRECRVVEPKAIYLDQLATQVKSITGQEVTDEDLRELGSF